MMRSEEKFLVAAATSAMSRRWTEGSKAALSHVERSGGLGEGRVRDKDRVGGGFGRVRLLDDLQTRIMKAKIKDTKKKLTIAAKTARKPLSNIFQKKKNPKKKKQRKKK